MSVRLLSGQPDFRLFCVEPKMVLMMMMMMMMMMMVMMMMVMMMMMMAHRHLGTSALGESKSG